MNAEESPKTLYELLGVPREAKPSQIREAFRDLARVYHPDSKYYADIIHDPIRAKHVALFQKILDAYHTLNSPEKRREYDSTLPSASSPEQEELAGFDAQGGQARESKGVKRSSAAIQPGPSVAEMMRSSKRRSRNLTAIAYLLIVVAFGVGTWLVVRSLRGGG
jgi:DnaJ-class molecular chaperone